MNDAIVEVLAEVGRRFRAELKAGSGLAGDFTPFQNEALSLVGRNRGITPKALTELCGREKAQVTRVLAELEGLGMVVRAPSRTDRRSMTIGLTAAGEAVSSRIMSRRADLAATMLAPLSFDEQTRLLDALRKMRQALINAEQDRSS